MHLQGHRSHRGGQGWLPLGCSPHWPYVAAVLGSHFNPQPSPFLSLPPPPSLRNTTPSILPWLVEALSPPSVLPNPPYPSQPPSCYPALDNCEVLPGSLLVSTQPASEASTPTPTASTVISTQRPASLLLTCWLETSTCRGGDPQTQFYLKLSLPGVLFTRDQS